MTPVQDSKSLPRLGAAPLRLLERLCNACAVSGDEGEVRKIVLEEVRPHADEVHVDALGSVLATRTAQQGDQPLRVMVDAHMDEIGFMIVGDDGEGLFRFETVGGIDARHLPGKPVWIGREHVLGVIGARPIHLSKPGDLKQTMPLDSLRIDVGPGNGGKVKVGDRAVFATSFTRLGPSIRAKALDDRFGVATLVELVKNPPPNIELQAAFTVQEEVGLRGAKAAAFAFKPDLAIALDCTPALDLPHHDGENQVYNTRLDAGPALYIADSSTLSDPRLVRFFIETAESLGIPYQIRQPGGGGTDAGAIHKQLSGIPSISVSVPGRYLHTAAAIARLDDWRNTYALVYAVLSRLTPALLAEPR